MRKVWISEEIDYLSENIGLQKVSTIAKNLNRSYDSVKVKMTRLGLSNTKLQLGYFTTGELANLLKVDRSTVRLWMKDHALPYKKRVTRESKSFYFIGPSDFWKWAEQHKDKVQFLAIEEQVLLPEPSWVEKERKKERDHQLIKKRRYRNWTIQEDRKLIALRSESLTFNEIAVKMNRTPTSVRNRYKRITSQTISIRDEERNS
ncbi:helix-turn-helix domain-containing protein [Psychrobacillus sp. NPDC096623]|uniref:helix-turn-helix domain-containing protein n=1 Tax=Psychrobacillus sp. NPDC096623 TaxID=3364492 RepID=UPI003815110F